MIKIADNNDSYSKYHIVEKLDSKKTLCGVDIDFWYWVTSEWKTSSFEYQVKIGAVCKKCLKING